MRQTTTPIANRPEHLYSRNFSINFPLVSAIVFNPMAVVFLCILLAGIGYFFSPHYALALLLLMFTFTTFYLERSLIDRIIVPPFSILSVWATLGPGLGISLVVFSRNGNFDYHLFQVQVVSFLSLIFGWAFYRLGFGRIPRMIFPGQEPDFDKLVVRPLFFVGWFFLLWQIVQIITLARFGGLDRGDFGYIAQERETFGIWTYFNLFPRFSHFGFFLLPLMWKRSPLILKVTIIPILGVYFLIAFSSGSRGIVFFPLIYMGIGIYFFRLVPRLKMDLLGVAFLFILFPMIVFIDAYRNTEAYRQTHTLDIYGRFSAIDDAYQRMVEMQESSEENFNVNMYTLGTALLGTMDHLVYEMTPEGISHARFENFNAIPYTFVPTFMMRDKPILIDSNQIIAWYLNRYDRTGRALSLEADAFRRFGWLGLAPVLALFYWIYGLVCGRFFRYYLRRDALFGILLIIFLLSYFQARPFGTILETWWQFSYNLLKHLAALYLGYSLLKLFLGIKIKKGALTFQRFHH